MTNEISEIDQFRDRIQKCESNVIRKAFAYWDEKRGSKRMPARRDLDPLFDITDIISHIGLIEIRNEDGRRRFFYRLIGTYTQEVLGADYTGRFLDEVLSGEFLDNVQKYCNVVCASRMPSLMVLTQPWKSVGKYYRLSAPLSDDGENVNILFHALDIVKKGHLLESRLEVLTDAKEEP